MKIPAEDVERKGLLLKAVAEHITPLASSSLEPAQSGDLVLK